jgi:ATP-dependent protease Clp ATPase subunit
MRVCDFCGKDEYSVGTMIANKNVHICDYCVMTSVDILAKRDTVNLFEEANDGK